MFKRTRDMTKEEFAEYIFGKDIPIDGVKKLILQNIDPSTGGEILSLLSSMLPFALFRAKLSCHYAYNKFFKAVNPYFSKKEGWKKNLKFEWSDNKPAECQDECIRIWDCYPPSWYDECKFCESSSGYQIRGLACNLDHNAYINCNKYKVSFRISAYPIAKPQKNV